MPIEVITVPCLADNYAYVLGDTVSGNAAVVDIPEAAPINAVLAKRGWQVTDVLITHHHPDHVDGLADLAGADQANIIGAKADAHRLPPLTSAVTEGDPLTVLAQDVQIFDVSGHTLGHIAFYFPTLGYSFTADSLMALGCGRLFEGSPAQMWDSLQKLRALPDETVICSGHEYTQSNLAFALTIEPDNSALRLRADIIQSLRAQNTPTVPSLLKDEKATNPFLRADTPELQKALKMEGVDPAVVFKEVRERKDNF